MLTANIKQADVKYANVNKADVNQADVIKADVNEFYDVSNIVMGRGAFGTVYEGTKKSDNKQKAAIKVINLGNLMPTSIELIHTEVKALQCLNHPNIVKLFDFYETPKKFYICMEVVKGGELFDRITQKKHYSENDARNLVVTLLCTVKHCHDNKIAHRDIKAENLLMVSDDDDADVKLVDFGFATHTEGCDMDGVIGSPDYMAPEIWVNKVKYGASVDMWSLGVLSYIILVGYPPFFDTAPLRLKTKIIRGNFEFHTSYWVNVSDEAKDFVSRLLTVDMTLRMTAQQALDHPWIALHSDVLTPRRLEDSIVQLKKFNAKRRLRASANAVLAVGKMSRLLSMSRNFSTSSNIDASASESADDQKDGINLDVDPKLSPRLNANIGASADVSATECVDISPAQEHRKSFDTDASAEATQSLDINTEGLDINTDNLDINTDTDTNTEGLDSNTDQSRQEFENDEDLSKAVHSKITELEEQNKTLLQFLNGIKEVKDCKLPDIPGIPVATPTASIRIAADSGKARNDALPPIRFGENQEEAKRLELEKNLATIKILQLNAIP